MRKSQAQYNKEHLARLRRKAKAFDQLVTVLDAVPNMADKRDANLAKFIENVVSAAKGFVEAVE